MKKLVVHLAYSRVENRAPAVASEDRFLRMYHTQELTYFDKELAYDFMTPVDLSRDSKNASLYVAHGIVSMLWC